ncbi:cytochrome P450 [Russula vinacea]|nr:cytochrome P450 [Russula vinacea]
MSSSSSTCLKLSSLRYSALANSARSWKLLDGVIFGLISISQAASRARGYPILGNLLEMTAGQWLKFAGWHKKYGDLIYLNAAGQPIVVINSRKAAIELLDRRGAIYLDKPRNVIVCDIMTRGLIIGFAPFGETWRRMRRAANEGFTKGSVKTFYETQITEAVFWLVTCLSEQDHILVGIKDFSDRLFKAALPGAHLVHSFPWLRHLPSSLAKWKRDTEAWYKKDYAMFEGLFHVAEANVAKGDDHQSVAATLIREREKNKLSSIERAWFGGTMYVGGAESSSSQMVWWMLAMLAYPETQARAHAELDAVVGRDRLPTFADQPHFPTFVPWSRKSYAGDLPGTICISNVWHMNRDPELFGENTEHFDPGRYLDASGDLQVAPDLPDIKEEGHFTYGFGRRICVGRHMADNSLFINMAMMLWATKIERKKDASGQLIPLDPDGWVDIGLVILGANAGIHFCRRPVPFEVEITPRFPEAPAMLAQERRRYSQELAFFRAEDVGKGRKRSSTSAKQTESTPRSTRWPSIAWVPQGISEQDAEYRILDLECESAYVAGHRDNLRILIGDTGHRAVTSIGDPVVDAIVYFVNWERIRVVRALDRKGSSGKARPEFKLQASSLDA